MRLITAALLIGLMSGAADAGDLFELHGLGAGAAREAGKAYQLPPVPPVFPAQPGPGALPSRPQGGSDTCSFEELRGGQCLFRCSGGGLISEPPVMTGPAGSESAACASHVILSPAPAGSRTMEDWQSVDLAADDGTVVSVDYVPADLGGKVLATRVWVSVRNPGFTGGEAVSAKLVNYYEATPYSAEAPKQEAELILPYNGWSYQAKFPDLSVFESYHSWQHEFRQEIAVFVNGRRLTDGTGRPAFSFKLPGKPAWAGGNRKAAQKGARACLFRELKEETCSYSCSDGRPYSRPAARPGPFGDGPAAPCPALVFPF